MLNKEVPGQRFVIETGLIGIIRQRDTDLQVPIHDTVIKHDGECAAKDVDGILCSIGFIYTTEEKCLCRTVSPYVDCTWKYIT